MLKFVNLPVFVVSLAVGVLFVYLYNDENRTVYVYPTTDSVDKIAYKDSAGNCFYYSENKIACPKDKSKIMLIPSQ
jgi:hypothetical protein